MKSLQDRINGGKREHRISTLSHLQTNSDASASDAPFEIIVAKVEIAHIKNNEAISLFATKISTLLNNYTMIYRDVLYFGYIIHLLQICCMWVKINIFINKVGFIDVMETWMKMYARNSISSLAMTTFSTLFRKVIYLQKLSNISK